MESSDEDEDDMLTIKRKDHEIQEDGKIINFQAYKSKSAHPLKSLSSLYS